MKLLWYIVLWLAAFVYVFCMTVSVVMFHFVVLVMIDEHAISGTGIYQVICMHRNAESFCLLEKSVFEDVFSARKWNIDQKMYLPKQKKEYISGFNVLYMTNSK